MRQLTIGSLFSGAGLCDLGFHRAGFLHRFFCEIDPYCQRVLKRHWPDVPVYSDIRDIEGNNIPDIDVLVGGFPCQDVSSAGCRKGINKKTRSGLWYEYKRIIKAKKPKYVVVENVKGLLSGGLDIVLQDLSSCGYHAEWQSISAAAFGAPHLRDRIFIIAYPHSPRTDGGDRIFTQSHRDVDNNIKPPVQLDWLGLQFNRASKKAIRQAYSGPAVCRVDDGSARGLDCGYRGQSYQIIDECEEVGIQAYPDVCIVSAAKAKIGYQG